MTICITLIHIQLIQLFQLVLIIIEIRKHTDAKILLIRCHFKKKNIQIYIYIFPQGALTQSDQLPIHPYHFLICSINDFHFVYDGQSLEDVRGQQRIQAGGNGPGLIGYLSNGRFSGLLDRLWT